MSGWWRAVARAGVRGRLLAALLVAAAAGGACAPGDRAAEKAAGPADSWLLVGAVVVDGTGAPARAASVRVAGAVVEAIGDLDPRPGETVVDAGGLVLAPGFIDTHSHADEGLDRHPEALAAVSQGITTVIVGQDGGSRRPLASWFRELEERGAAVNVASYSGHGTLRREVLGEDFRRPATAAEVERMAEALRQDLAAGALGLSTGLEYDPGIYSATSEVVELARVAAAAGGRYISHVRSEDRRFWPALEELVTIGREAALPVQVSHLKLALRSLHGRTGRLTGLLDRARREGVAVSADLYPYTYWQSTLTVLFPERDFEDRDAARFAVTELAAPEEMLLARYDPAPGYAGKTLAEIAGLEGSDPAETLIRLIRMAETMRRERGDPEADVESVLAVSMTEADVEELLRWPHANVCTDGELDGAHPRGFGAFPRVLGRYVRERGALSLEEAVRKMSALAADHMGLADRGRLLPGLAADLVLFDPATVADRATTDDPHALAEGIDRVWVNGELVYSAGAVSGRRPGRVLRRGGAGTGNEEERS